MDFLKDKVAGSWYGMAVGDAMGLAAKSIKPETVRQLFGAMDSFKDVRPFIGKGIKRFTMQGLYGGLTQSSLVIADCLLKNKKGGVSEISQLLLKLSAGGPEHYFGVYRRPEKGFYKSICALKEKPPRAVEHDQADAAFLTMGIPAGIIHRDRPEAGIRLNVDIGLLLSRNLCEVTGLALTGYLASRFLSLELGNAEGPVAEAEQILTDAEEFCQKVETRFRETAPGLWDETAESARGMLGQTLEGLRKRWNVGLDELLEWVCQNASDWHKTSVTSPAQGYVLTLLPLCLILVLREGRGFDSSLTGGLNMGKAADKVGVLVGAWSGAIYGWQGIPESWRSGLVNGKEVRLRAEGLFSRRFPKGAKDIYEMELGLTSKEFEVGKKYFQKTSTKFTRPTPRPMLSWEDDSAGEPVIPEKSDAASWRKFHKDKSRMKKDRRKHLKENDDDD
ncbi:MAG: ADP-ribosylglycohydrolase family protein [Nitrospinaceae bacterium]|jgi:hypothetical protein|nr:ADP-ribosylglycohydrolase family protein [Nitrospinaceae bacterium]MDP7148680.1 ADP-ribosylglycohydrolase family protein [Nitrospinaceae bacterium]|tara:strand:- start:591 stop:1934 length:1344 start_codon:yes stop_codon:yes gene_type:complete